MEEGIAARLTVIRINPGHWPFIVVTEMSRKRPQTSIANGVSAISLSFKIEQQIGRMLSAIELRPAVLFAVIWLGWLISWMVAALWSNRIEKRLFPWDVLVYRILIVSGVILFCL
jgi:hypothetical protein